MNKFKKLISWVLSLAMVFSLLPLQLVFAVEQPVVTVENASVTVKEGSSPNYVYVPVSIKNNPGINGFALTVSIPDGWSIKDFRHTNQGKTEGSVFTEYDEEEEEFVILEGVTDQANKTIGKYALGYAMPIDTDGVLFWIRYQVPYNTVNGLYTIEIESCDKISTGSSDIKGDTVFNVGKVTVTGGMDQSEVYPAISTHPKSDSYTYNKSIAALTVEASVPPHHGGDLTYQWYSNTTNSNEGGTLIDGAITNTYQPAAEYGTHYYYCVVSTTFNGAPYSTASEVAAITYAQAELPEVTLNPSSFTYDGTAHAPVVTVDGLTEGVDYTISGDTSATNAGSYTVTVTGKGNYTGTVNKVWTIQKLTVDAPVAVGNLSYTGAEQTGVVADEG